MDEVSQKPLVRGLSVAIAIVATVYCAEELVSGGRMSQAVFGAAANVSRVHPGGWLHVATVFAAVVGNSVGLIALLGAAALAGLDVRSTAASSFLRITAAGLVVVLGWPDDASALRGQVVDRLDDARGGSRNSCCLCYRPAFSSTGSSRGWQDLTPTWRSTLAPSCCW